MHFWHIKVKFSLEQAVKAQRVGGQHHAPATLPPAKTQYPLYRRLGRPQGWSGRVRKISPPPGFDPWTVQPVASRYTDCAIPAPALLAYSVSKFVNLTTQCRWKLRTAYYAVSSGNFSQMFQDNLSVPSSRVSLEDGADKLT